MHQTSLSITATLVCSVAATVVTATDSPQQIGRRSAQNVIHFGEGISVTKQDLYLARKELEILRMLRADVLLKAQDLQGIFLGELLFSDSSASATLVNRIKQTIRQNQFSISEKQINDIYRRQAPPYAYWLCLQHETRLAGISLPNAEVNRLLTQIVPQLFDGLTYSKIISEMMKRYATPEDQILATLGKLLAVLQYANMVCSNEGLTTRQVIHAASIEEETIDVEFVKFDAAIFAKTQEFPGEEEIIKHFDKYKNYFPGQVSDDNPYGFGYKQPDKVRLEYIAVKLEDIRTIIRPPTQDEMGEYYIRNRDKEFTEQVQSDPNDPNSLTERVKPYAEVADSILEQLFKSKTRSRAEIILQEAKMLTEAELADITHAEIADLNTEQFAKLAGDYEATAQRLSDKYRVKVYTGRTGLLGPREMQTDEQLRTLFIRGYGRNPIMLSQVVFAIDELAASELGPFDVQKPRVYENIGPVRDWITEHDISETILILVRVIEAHKASTPESIDQTFSTVSFRFDPTNEETDENIYSVKEKVVEDVKKLAAMNTAKARADQFIVQAAKYNWKEKVDRFNELHRQQQGRDANESDAFRLQTSQDLRRTSRATLRAFAVQNQGNPAAQFLLNDAESNRRFVDKLYSLVPADSDTAKNLPIVLEVKPDMSYYAIRNISVKRLWKEDYEKNKAMRSYQEDYVQSQSLAAVHFNPGNILKRNSFRLVGKGVEAKEVDPERLEHIEFNKLLTQFLAVKFQILQGKDTSNTLILPDGPAEKLRAFAQGTSNGEMAALALIKLGEALRTELHYRPHIVTEQDLTQQIDRAKTAYNEAIRRVQKSDTTSKVNSSLAAAKVGLALCEEELGNFDVAEQIYHDIVADPAFKGTVAVAQAGLRLGIVADYKQEMVFQPAPKPKSVISEKQ